MEKQAQQIQERQNLARQACFGFIRHGGGDSCCRCDSQGHHHPQHRVFNDHAPAWSRGRCAAPGSSMCCMRY